MTKTMGCCKQDIYIVLKLTVNNYILISEEKR